MAVLLLAEMAENGLNLDATAKAVTAVAPLGDVTVLVAGAGAEAAAAEAAKIDGVAKVLTATGDAYAHRLAEPLAALVVELSSQFSHIAAPGTTDARNVLPGAAALLDVMIVPEVSKIVDADTFERSAFTSAAVQTVKSSDKIKVLTVRIASFDAAGQGGSAAVEAAPEVADPALSTWVSDEVAKSDRPELTSAKRIVSGGRAVGSKEKFEIIEQLADKLGAAVGASRAAVDSGYAPNDWQVGQTGKVVAPELYIAAGISGAIQHLAGMKDSKVIVAINKDEEAPIFQIADYGLVGDIFTVLPELTAKL